MSDVYCRGRDTPGNREEAVSVFELAIVRRGVLAREYRGRRALLVPGTVAVFQPGQPYRITHPVGGGDVCTVITVPPELLDQLAPRHMERPTGASTRWSAMLRSDVWLRLMLATRAARAADTVRADEELVRVLPDLLPDAQDRPRRQRTPAEPARRRASELAAHVAAEIGRRYAEPLTLGSLAKSVHVSPFHLSRMVHAACGAPVHQLLLRHRLHAAVERVLDGTGDLSRLALEIGFSSHSHFTASFRSAFGMTPTQLRRAAAGTGRRTGSGPGGVVRNARLAHRRPGRR